MVARAITFFATLLKRDVGNDVVWERLAGIGPIRLQHCGRRIIDREQVAVLIFPVRKIALIHLRQRDGELVGSGACTVSEPLVRQEEERFVSAIVDLRNPDGTADGSAEIVLLQDRLALVVGIVEEPCGVEIIVAKEFIKIAVKLIRTGLRYERKGSTAWRGRTRL